MVGHIHRSHGDFRETSMGTNIFQDKNFFEKTKNLKENLITFTFNEIEIDLPVEDKIEAKESVDFSFNFNIYPQTKKKKKNQQ